MLHGLCLMMLRTEKWKTFHLNLPFLWIHWPHRKNWWQITLSNKQNGTARIPEQWSCTKWRSKAGLWLAIWRIWVTNNTSLNLILAIAQWEYHVFTGMLPVIMDWTVQWHREALVDMVRVKIAEDNRNKSTRGRRQCDLGSKVPSKRGQEDAIYTAITPSKRRQEPTIDESLAQNSSVSRQRSLSCPFGSSQRQTMTRTQSETQQQSKIWWIAP